MTDDRDLDAVVSAWLRQVPPSDADAVERLAVRVSGVRQRRRSGPIPIPALIRRPTTVSARGLGTPVVGHRPRHATSERASGRPALALATLALAVAAIAIGTLALSGTDSPPSSLDGPRPGPLLPDQIPNGLVQGVITTPIGSARWVHLTGDPTSLPGNLMPFLAPGGLAWFDQAPWGGLPGLWTSDGALSERVQRPLPVAAVDLGLRLQGGTFWLSTSDPVTLWRSPDAVTWEEVDLSTLVSPGPRELAWTVGLGRAAASSGMLVVPVTYQAVDAERLLGVHDAGGGVHPEPLGNGLYRVVADDRSGADQLGFVRIEATSTGIAFMEPSGAPIASLAGVGMEFVDAWTADGAVLKSQLVIIDGAMITTSSLPEPPLGGPWLGSTLFPVDDGFMVFGRTGDGTIQTWRSPDGRAWVEGELLGDGPGEPRDARSVTIWDSSDGASRVVVRTNDGTRWESVDGRSWMALTPPAGAINFLHLSQGWVADADGRWWVSQDGTTWDQATELEAVIDKAGPDGAGEDGTFAIGDALLNVVNESEETQQRDLWIIDFGGDPRPPE